MQEIDILVPKLTWNIVITVPGEDSPILSFCGDVDRRMDEIQNIVGNGLAKVSVGADVAIKDFGTGASAFCSITLSCNQDEKTIDRAVSIAGDLARGYAQEQRERAEQELQMILSQRGGGRPPQY